MRKLILLSLVVSFCCGFQSLTSLTAVPIDSQKNLIVFDIDHTLVETETFVGSEAWFKDLLSHSTNIKQDIAFYNLVQQVTDMTPTQPHVSSYVETLKQKGNLVIFITSRGKEIAQRTQVQLAKHHISPTQELNLCATEQQYGLCQNNIYFTAGGDKGLALLEVLQNNAELKKRKIYFIDDQTKHLERVSKTLDKHGYNYEVYHYTTSIEKFATMPVESMEPFYRELLNLIQEKKGELSNERHIS